MLCRVFLQQALCWASVPRSRELRLISTLSLLLSFWATLTSASPLSHSLGTWGRYLRRRIVQNIISFCCYLLLLDFYFYTSWELSEIFLIWYKLTLALYVSIFFLKRWRSLVNSWSSIKLYSNKQAGCCDHQNGIYQSKKKKLVEVMKSGKILTLDFFLPQWLIFCKHRNEECILHLNYTLVVAARFKFSWSISLGKSIWFLTWISSIDFKLS